MHFKFIIIINSNSYKRYFIISFFVIVDNKKKYRDWTINKKNVYIDSIYYDCLLARQFDIQYSVAFLI